MFKYVIKSYEELGGHTCCATESNLYPLDRETCERMMRKALKDIETYNPDRVIISTEIIEVEA